MSFSCPDLSLEEFLSLAERLDYDSVEPRIQSGHGHGIDLDTNAEARKRMKGQAEDFGVPYCCVATSCSYADPQTVQSQVEDTIAAIDLAADIGAPRVRVFGGRLADGLDRDDAVNLLAESLASVAEQARKRDVIVCVETHDDWCDPDDLARVMSKVNHPNIAVNWDIMHPVHRAGKTMDQAFQTLRPWIRHVHVHDGVVRDGNSDLTPIGEGSVDHERAMELLTGMGYDGAISGEWIGWEPYETHLPRELELLRQIFAKICAGSQS